MNIHEICILGWKSSVTPIFGSALTAQNLNSEMVKRGRKGRENKTKMGIRKYSGERDFQLPWLLLANIENMSYGWIKLRANFLFSRYEIYFHGAQWKP